MSISRRVFVKSGGLALVSFGLDPLFVARAAFTSYEPLPPHAACCRPVLVCLFQRGAVDGLNMIVPHGDPIYYQERPRIAVPEKDVLDLDGYFGLHPGLAALKPLRSEEHTSELQSPCNLVCRLLLEKKKSACNGFSIAMTLRSMKAGVSVPKTMVI